MYPGHSRTTMRSVCCRAMATVSSVLIASTSTMSSANRTDASAASMSAASFLVMTVTESFGTVRSISKRASRAGAGGVTAGPGRLSRREGDAVASPCPARLTPLLRADDRRIAGDDRARARRRNAGESAVERDALHGVEVDERLVVVGDRLDLGDPRDREVALRLEHEKALRHAGGELLLLGVEFLLLQ